MAEVIGEDEALKVVEMESLVGKMKHTSFSEEIVIDVCRVADDQGCIKMLKIHERFGILSPSELAVCLDEYANRGDNSADILADAIFGSHVMGGLTLRGFDVSAQKKTAIWLIGRKAPELYEIFGML